MTPIRRVLAQRHRWLELSLVALLLVPGIAGYLLWTEHVTHRSVQQRILERQAQSTLEFEAWMEERRLQARHWADRDDTRALVAALLALHEPTREQLEAHPLQQAFRREFAAALGREGVQGYFIVSPQGRSLGSLGRENVGGENLLWAETEFFERMRTHGVALSPLMASDVELRNGGVELDGRPLTMFVGVPVHLDGSDAPAAYFTLRLPPVSLLAVQGRARFGQGGVSYLVDRHGRLHADRSWLNLDLGAFGLASEPFRGRPHLFARDPGSNLLLHPGLQGDRGRMPLTRSAAGLRDGGGLALTPYRDHRGLLVVGSWTWDDRLGLGIVTEIPAAEAYAPLAAARLHVLIAVALLALAAVVNLLRRLQRSRRELKAALASAEAASRAKGVFVANMSHEIRTPLNAVLGIAHLLAGTPLTAAQREYLRMISTSGEALLAILNDILDYSKVEAGKLELLETEFSLHDTIDALASIMSVNASAKDLELVIGIEPNVPTHVVGDAQRLLQILVNLTGNAIKFTERGEVALRVALDGALPWVRFEVHDTGVGIAPEKQGQLFNAFTQADAGVARNFGGSGLGLAICKRLVDLMGGEIGLESDAGQGSTFWFRVPLRPGSAAAARDPGAPRRVWIVDDSETAREFIAKSVARVGWQPRTVASGVEAVALVARHDAPCDVLLVDWHMPGLDGLATSKAIRALGRTDAPIVIMVTALGRDQVLASPDADCVDAVISKPATPSKILDAVMDAQARRRGGVPLHPAGPLRVLRQLVGVRVLLAEDNPINQQVARGMLESEGARVTTAGDGQAAYELLSSRAEDFDLVLMDVQMPVQDGITATRRVRRELGLGLPILAMSAGVTEEERSACYEAGMDGFIAKPLDPQTVAQDIRRYGGAGAPALPWRIEGIDLARLAQSLNGGAQVIEPLLGKLEQECRLTLATLQSALEEGAMSRVLAALHTFKGTCATLRADALARQAEHLERAARDGGIDAVRHGYAAFRDEVEGLCERISSALGQQRPIGETLG